MLPVYEEPDDVDGQEGVVKPGFVQCIAQHHPDRKEGKQRILFLSRVPKGFKTLRTISEHIMV
jgi:hypothetical protein